MSVGEALGTPAYQVDATNLAEARAMHGAREAAMNLSVRKQKRRSGKDKAKSKGRRRYVDPDDGGYADYELHQAPQVLSLIHI